MLIELNVKRDGLIKQKIKRFNELKIGYFEDNLEESEQIELDEIERWLKIHNI
jgi:hypothetical protein